MVELKQVHKGTTKVISVLEMRKVYHIVGLSNLERRYLST